MKTDTLTKTLATDTARRRALGTALFAVKLAAELWLVKVWTKKKG